MNNEVQCVDISQNGQIIIIGIDAKVLMMQFRESEVNTHNEKSTDETKLANEDKDNQALKIPIIEYHDFIGHQSLVLSVSIDS